MPTMDHQKSEPTIDAAVTASRSRISEEHVFHAAVLKTRMAMTVADPRLPDCPLVYVNPAFIKTTGYKTEQVIGKNCRFLQGPDTNRAAVRRIKDAIAAQVTFDQDIYNYRRDGSGFWNALHVSPLFDDEGNLIYYFASQVDISDRKEAARRLEQRRQSTASLTAGVAHEFNNLMTTVIGSVERAGEQAAAADGHRLPPAVARQLQRADKAARRAGQLAAHLLALSRHQFSDTRTVELNDLMRDFAPTLAQAAGSATQLRLDLVDEPAAIRVDDGQLKIVLLNLARNAADAMAGGGVMVIRVRVLAGSAATVEINGEEAVELSVSDTGIGMTPDVLARATELFFTTKNAGGGAGVGLFMALELVDQCGGKLILKSKPGGGTVARLLFPRSKPV